jgi:hypothetical protein
MAGWHGAGAGAGAKLPRLTELICSGPSDAELGQLGQLGPAAAGVQRLEVRALAPRAGPSSAHLPSLQVCNSGWPQQGPAPGPRSAQAQVVLGF